MSITTAVIAELIRAANEADRLSPFEVKRLLNRSIATIGDMRKLSQTKKTMAPDRPQGSGRTLRHPSSMLLFVGIHHELSPPIPGAPISA